MNKMFKIADGVDVKPLLHSIELQPGLWNQYALRTTHLNSPHAAVSDIWIRYNAWKNLDPACPQNFSDEHDSVWYPAYAALPEVQPIIFQLMRHVQGERLGGVLITRIPPGGKVAPHADGGWHAGYYKKYAVHLEAGPGQTFNFEGESHCAEPGDIYQFDNSATHWVNNDSAVDRTTLIICIKN